MSDKTTKYVHLPYLDSTDQPFIQNAQVSALKNPLRRAINENRTNADGMDELILLLKQTLTHAMKKKSKKKPKTEIVVESDIF